MQMYDPRATHCIHKLLATIGDIGTIDCTSLDPKPFPRNPMLDAISAVNMELRLKKCWMDGLRGYIPLALDV